MTRLHAHLALASAFFFAAAQVASAGTDGSDLGGALLDKANMERSHSGLSSLENQSSLSQVAADHARDMAQRGYVGYDTPEGVSLLELVRQADRSSLISSFGSTIAVLDAGASADEIYKTLMSDPTNADCVTRGFNRAGIGVHEADGRLYVVQLYARIEGQLESPLPASLSAPVVLKSDLSAPAMKSVGWSVTSPEGEVLARGTGARIRPAGGALGEGYLNVDVAVGADVYTFRGPSLNLD